MQILKIPTRNIFEKKNTNKIISFFFFCESITVNSLPRFLPTYTVFKTAKVFLYIYYIKNWKTARYDIRDPSLLTIF